MCVCGFSAVNFKFSTRLLHRFFVGLVVVTNVVFNFFDDPSPRNELSNEAFVVVTSPWTSRDEKRRRGVSIPTNEGDLCRKK